jgi:Zn-dependent metalloprotease
MRRIVVALLALGLFGSQALAANTQPQPSMTTAQARVLAGLPEVRTVALDAVGVPTFIAGRLGHLGAGDPAGAALRYLESLRPLLRATGREEVAPARVERDDLGQVHIKLQQYHRGLPVVGAELVVHADAATGEVRVVNGRFVPDEGLPARARIGAEAALLKAAQDADIRDGRVLDQPELVYVVSHDEKTYLAWSARVAYNGAYGPAVDRVFASALDGDLVTLHPTIHSAKNRKIYNGNHTNPDNPTLPGTLMFQEGATSSSDAAAWDCYVNFGYTYDYYKNRFNRDSFDNAGGALIGTVHVGTDWVNAYWNGTQMVFGDGNGTDATYLSKALDIVAHELTHAVTDRTAGLVYQNESGGLNEAMSDIFAAGAEAYKVGAVNTNTWLVGEDAWTPATSGDALRYMANPTQDGYSADYYPERLYPSCTPTSSNDYCGVHGNSGIANLAFYLLSQGGTHPRSKTTISVPAIGIAKAEQIFFRALTTGLMTSTTNFQGTRNATKTAAEQLYGAGAAEVTAVTACWDAVGAPGGTVPVTTLTNGVGLGSQGASTGNYLNYKITVPSGQTSLVVTTTGGTGDADLYVKRGTQASSSTYDGKSEGSTSAETVTISNPVAGDFYVALYAYATFSGVTVKATYTGTTASFTLAASPTSLTVAQGASGSSTMTTTVSGGFNSAVALSAAGAPSGATVSFSPTSIAAPGSGTSTMTVAAGTAAAGTYTITVTGSGGSVTKTATVSLTVTASGGGVTVLTNGQTVTGIAVATGAWKHYKLTVPASQTSLVINMSGGTGDGDMYVKLGAQPTSSSYDYRPYKSGNAESVSVTNPAAGDWYISIYGYAACSGVSLVATYSASGGGTTMNETESNNTTATANTISTSGTTVTGYVGTTTDSDYFKVTLPAGKTLVADLTVPSTKDYDLKLYNSSGTQIGSSTNGAGAAEKITYANSGSSSITVYLRVYGYNSAYSTTLTYQLKATW